MSARIARKAELKEIKEKENHRQIILRSVLDFQAEDSDTSSTIKERENFFADFDIDSLEAIASDQELQDDEPRTNQGTSNQESPPTSSSSRRPMSGVKVAPNTTSSSSKSQGQQESLSTDDATHQLELAIANDQEAQRQDILGKLDGIVPGSSVLFEDAPLSQLVKTYERTAKAPYVWVPPAPLLNEQTREALLGPDDETDKVHQEEGEPLTKSTSIPDRSVNSDPDKLVKQPTVEKVNEAAVLVPVNSEEAHLEFDEQEQGTGNPKNNNSDKSVKHLTTAESAAAAEKTRKRKLEAAKERERELKKQATSSKPSSSSSSSSRDFSGSSSSARPYKPIGLKAKDLDDEEQEEDDEEDDNDVEVLSDEDYEEEKSKPKGGSKKKTDKPLKTDKKKSDKALDKIKKSKAIHQKYSKMQAYGDILDQLMIRHIQSPAVKMPGAPPPEKMTKQPCELCFAPDGVKMTSDGRCTTVCVGCSCASMQEYYYVCPWHAMKHALCEAKEEYFKLVVAEYEAENK